MVSTGIVAGQVGLAAQGSTLPIIPQPARVERADGAFVIDENTTIVADAASMAEARKLQDCLAPAMGFRLKLVENNQSQGGAITLKTNDAFRGPSDEGYSLSVAPDGILIGAKARPGLFYGIQTLRQLLPPAIFRLARVEGVRWEVPCVRIEDQPRFKWRGLLVDTARHFVPKSSLLKFIDTMALHKFNSLQLHLTDDQGWRIEIKKYPKLTEIGAWRDETLVGHISATPWQFDGRRHGGFYTQDDIRETVRYAADRHINIVPEIEMPGHARAAISAYPHLGCNPDTPLRPWTIWGVCPDIFCPTEQTVAFMQDVLAEVLQLFPSPYIHIGGDEAVKDQWKASPVVQARIKELGLKDEAEMQSWFVKQMDTFLTKQGRRLVGWDEILEGGLAPGAVVMSWRGEKGGITAAKSGHDVVMTPVEDTYLNLYQGPKDEEPLSFVGDLPLRKVYMYEPIPADLSEEESLHVLGTQGQLWSEYIPNPRQLEYMAYPRAAALAEVAWSAKEQRGFDSFLDRLRQHLQRLKIMDVNFRPLDE
ncbi:MAG: beta-N-acetylhexosaminidase [Planctomycetes bacterium]|nr:beta-N-acetylhexosaminidase [Planctomycetota bacterium]